MSMKLVSVIVLASLFLNGCASYLSYQYSKEELATKRICASGSKEAMDALKNGVSPQSALKLVPTQGGAFLMFDVTASDALIQHPYRQIGAAVLDAATGYGIYLLGENNEWWGDVSDDEDNTPSIQVNNTGNENTIVVITGDNVSGSGNPDNSSASE